MSLVPYICRYRPIDKLLDELLVAHHWLNPTECKILDQFSNLLRRKTWLAGRWLAKELILKQINKNAGNKAALEWVAGENGHSLHAHVGMGMVLTNGMARYGDIEIVSAGRKPQVSLKGKILPWSLSIAHTSRGALVALSCRPNITPGVDLVEIRDYGPGFSSLWFTESERRRWKRSGNCGYAVAWAIKEALYKAVNNGESFEPRTINTIPCGASGNALWFRVGGKPRLCQLMSWQMAMNEIAVCAMYYKGDIDD